MGKDMKIYFLDMAGGASTLIVTPFNESILIDTGSLEPKHRDADRIYLACQEAGIAQIDYLITTHFHSDHFGGILNLSKKIPIKKFFDKGALPEKDEQETTWFKELYPLYQQATKGQTAVLHAGDDVPLMNDPNGNIPIIRLHCVASQKKVEGFHGDIDAPVKGFIIKEPDFTDNGKSIALILSYGSFSFFAGGDITWNVEHHLVHPVNRIGEVDLYQVTHHGLDHSNNPQLVKALNPLVCIAMNGPTKGISDRTFQVLNSQEGIQALYQLHYNIHKGEKGNTNDEFIANKKDSPGGKFIKVTVHPDEKTFTAAVGKNGPIHQYSFQ